MLIRNQLILRGLVGGLALFSWQSAFAGGCVVKKDISTVADENHMVNRQKLSADKIDELGTDRFRKTLGWNCSCEEGSVATVARSVDCFQYCRPMGGWNQGASSKFGPDDVFTFKVNGKSLTLDNAKICKALKGVVTDSHGLPITDDDQVAAGITDSNAKPQTVIRGAVGAGGANAYNSD